MKLSKNAIYILFTIAVVILSCIYLFNINTTYDGAVDVSLKLFVFTLPFTVGIQLWGILRKGQKESPQKTWQKIFFWCLMASFLILTLYLLINSNFYSLPAILFLVIILFCGINIFVDKKIKEKSTKNPVFALAISMIFLYALTCGTVFTYLQIIKPITVEQACILLEEEYGEDSYEYIGRLTGIKEKTPLGRYWFVPRNSKLTKGIAVSVITGEIMEHK